MKRVILSGLILLLSCGTPYMRKANLPADINYYEMNERSEYSILPDYLTRPDCSSKSPVGKELVGRKGMSAGETAAGSCIFVVIETEYNNDIIYVFIKSALKRADAIAKLDKEREEFRRFISDSDVNDLRSGEKGILGLSKILNGIRTQGFSDPRIEGNKTYFTAGTAENQMVIFFESKKFQEFYGNINNNDLKDDLQKNAVFISIPRGETQITDQAGLTRVLPLYEAMNFYYYHGDEIFNNWAGVSFTTGN